MPLVVEGSVPAEVVCWYFHRGGDLVAVCEQQVAPCFRVIVAVADSILSTERDDVRPDVALVFLQLGHSCVQVNMILVTEQPVRAKPLCPRSCRNVLHVYVGVLHVIPMRLNCCRDQRRRSCLCWLPSVVHVLVAGFRIRKISDELFDELLLLARRRTVVRQYLHPLPCADVTEIAVSAATAASAFDVRTLDNQSSHSSSPPVRPRTCCSNEMRPLVSFTFRTLSLRSFCRASSFHS